MKATRFRAVASPRETIFVLPKMKPRTRTENTGRISLIKMENIKDWQKNSKLVFYCV